MGMRVVVESGRWAPEVRGLSSQSSFRRYRESVASAIVETVFDLQGVIAGPLAVQETARFLVDEAEAMPHVLAPGMAALTALFDASAIARAGKPFHRLPLAARRRHLLAWRGARLDAFRSFAKFHETFSVYHHFGATLGETVDA